MINYILLSLGLASLLLAIGCLSITILCAHSLYEKEDSDKSNEMTTKTLLYSGIGLVVFSAISWKLYSYLLAEHHHVLLNFGLWYIIGLTSRLLLLAKRQEILSPWFETDWNEVFYALFIAIGGPTVTLHLLWTILVKKEKSPLE